MIIISLSYSNYIYRQDPNADQMQYTDIDNINTIPPSTFITRILCTQTLDYLVSSPVVV